MRVNSYCQKLWIIVFILSFTLPCCLVIADENSEYELDIAQALQSNSILQMKVKMDSVYGDISASYPTVEPIFKKSCFDCHSSQTKYPWYHSLPIIEGWIDSHIKEGREHLKLSNGFPFGGGGIDQLKLLQEIKEEVDEGDMPFSGYTIFHWDASIEGETKDSLFVWLDASIVKLEKLYEGLGIPIDAEADEDEDDKYSSDDD